MKRQWPILMVIVISWLSLTSTVQAKFDPYVEDPAHDWGDVTNPEPVWSSGALVGHLGRLDPAGDVDAFALKFDAPIDKWTFSLSVPVCANHFNSVQLNMALIGPGLAAPTVKLPFDLPDGMGAVVHSTTDKGKDSILYRNTDVMGIPTYVYPTFVVNIPTAATYVMAVWAEDKAVAPYILLTGTGNDQFSNRSPAEQEKAFTQTFSGEWMHQDCTPPPATPVPLTFMGHVNSIPHMIAARAAHTATLLNNGKVLIAGGIAFDGGFLKSAELYDPVTNSFDTIGNMTTARASHTATLLANGKVLLVGGDYQGKMVSAELYDPVTNTFTATGSLHTARDGFQATLLRDGRVLITGMGKEGGASAEIYDLATGLFTVTGDMKTPRTTHTATLLPDGKVLIAGGMDGQGNVLANAELYNPVTATFTSAPYWMTVKRHKQAAISLKDGRVLIMGGADENDWNGQRRTAEIYDPTTGLFKPTGAMVDPHFKFDTAVALLPDGDVVVGGASKHVEIYRMDMGAFAVSNGDIDTERYFSTATTLADGSVLIAGGYDRDIQASPKAWIYNLK